MFELASDVLLLLSTLLVYKIDSPPLFAMPMLGDDFQEDGDGPFDAVPMMGTLIALLALGVMMALVFDGNGDAGCGIDGGGDGGGSDGEDEALSDDVVEETQDELVAAEEGRLESTTPEQRPKRPRAPKQIHSIAHEDIINSQPPRNRAILLGFTYLILCMGPCPWL